MLHTNFFAVPIQHIRLIAHIQLGYTLVRSGNLGTLINNYSLKSPIGDLPGQVP